MQAFAVICLGILQGGFYYSSYFPQYQPDGHSNSKYFCLLGFDIRVGYYDRYSRYGVRNDHNPQVCRLGMAVAYISIILSLLMLCKESLKKTTNVMPTLTPLGANFPTTRLLVAIAVLLLWLASLIYSFWGWIVLNNNLTYFVHNDKSDIKAAGAFYIIFHTLSVMSWVIFLFTFCIRCLQYFDFLETGLCCLGNQTKDDDVASA